MRLALTNLSMEIGTFENLPELWHRCVGSVTIKNEGRQSGATPFQGAFESCMFTRAIMDEPLPKADVVMMGHILHDRNLEIKQMLAPR